MVAEFLLDLERLGPLIADATQDVRWLNMEPRLIEGGKSNLTFKLTSEAGDLILRRPPTGGILPRAHDMSREVRIQRALQPTPVPVPRIVLECGPEILGTAFYVMQMVPGHVIYNELPIGYAQTEQEKRQLSFAMIDVLTDLHAINPEFVGLDGFGRPEGFLARQVGRFCTQWELSKTAEVPIVDELGRQLWASIPISSSASIVHGDYRLDNCIVDAHDPGTISAVLDWEMSTIGDPLTDLGLLLFYWREQGDREPSLIPFITSQPGFPSRQEMAERYMERMGVHLEDIAFYEALAHFKFAIIAQGISKRVSMGVMAGQEFGDIASEVEWIAQAGLLRLTGKEA